LTEFTQILFAIDAPEGDDSIAAVGGFSPVSFLVWDMSNKASPRALYQDYGSKVIYQVYAARIGNRDYGFAADFQGDAGLHLYDMTTARGYGALCSENRTQGESNCPGVYLGRIGSKSATKYVHGLAVGSRHFVAKSAGISGKTGVEIWEVSNPLSPSLVVKALDAPSNGYVHGVAMWTQSGRHYLALREDANSRIYDVTTCLTSGCTGLDTEVWSQRMEPYPESLHWLSVTFSRSDSIPFLYWGNHDECRQNQGPGTTEYLFDVSNASLPREITPDGTIVDEGIAVDYWSWYYSDFSRGFSKTGPRSGKFLGQYFYRANSTIMDIHKWVGGGGPPIANFTYSPTEIYPGDLVTFTDTSIGNVTSRTWTFPDGSPPGGTTTPLGVTFGSLGTKAVTLDVANSNGPASKTQNVPVLDPVPAVAAAGSAPANPLVCQPVTLTATGVT
ncbi:MAG: PKD domain-containing protein, partial [Anaerolineales bacterium]